MTWHCAWYRNLLIGVFKIQFLQGKYLIFSEGKIMWLLIVLSAWLHFFDTSFKYILSGELRSQYFQGSLEAE